MKVASWVSSLSSSRLEDLRREEEDVVTESVRERALEAGSSVSRRLSDLPASDPFLERPEVDLGMVVGGCLRDSLSSSMGRWRCWL
jgi:hypothetical protein